MTTTTSTTTFAKLADGSWGIQGIGLVSGQTVTVTKRDGETKQVVVGDILPGRGGYGNVFATIATAPRVTAEVTVPALPDAKTVPAGRYAVATESGAINTLAFYRVDRPTEGKWAGKVFVKHLVGGDEQSMSFPATKAVLAKIVAVGAEAASAAYGHEIGKCGVCHIRLTNDESRARGIGPDCRARLGW